MVLLSSKNEWEIVNSSLYILLLLIFWSSIYLVKECVRERVKSVEKEERWLASSQTNSSDYGKLSEIPDIGRHFVTARVSVGPNQHRGRSWARVRASSAVWGQFITAITAGAEPESLRGLLCSWGAGWCSCSGTERWSTGFMYRAEGYIYIYTPRCSGLDDVLESVLQVFRYRHAHVRQQLQLYNKKNK